MLMTPRPQNLLRGAALLVALLALLLLPGLAAASSSQESVFEDEHELLQLGAARQASALNDIAALGADSIRSLVSWNQVAPAPSAKKRPKGFDGANPAAYAAGKWDPYDDLVRGAQARGMTVLLSPSSPIPAWASGCRGSADARRACRPNARQFGLFVRALGTRYSGTYADENQGGGILPRVDRWSIWNEPNQPGWLNPQSSSVGGRKVITAARMYRDLSRSAIAGLRATGHGSDLLMLGETAPIGRASGTLARRPTTPVEFIRALFCLRSSGRRLTGTDARLAGCSGFSKLRVNAFAHHPYTRGGSQPPTFRTLPGEITIATAARLKTLLAQGARAGRVPGKLPIWYTEFGFQTKVKGDFFGVSNEAQARYLNQSDWIASRDPRVKSVAQYKLVDDALKQNFQTGLRFLDHSAKPSYDAYRLPIWVTKRSGGKVRVYGQVRPAADNAAEMVEVQNGSGGSFQTVYSASVTSRKGQFLVTLPAGAGSWRLKWTPAAGGTPLYSRVAKVARK
jgi:hypothetical protein